MAPSEQPKESPAGPQGEDDPQGKPAILPEAPKELRVDLGKPDNGKEEGSIEYPEPAGTEKDGESKEDPAPDNLSTTAPENPVEEKKLSWLERIFGKKEEEK